MTLDDLATACACEVSVSINPHTSYYQPLADYLDEVAKRAVLRPGMRERIIAADRIVELQFYPDTPIGFYTVVGATLDECLVSAGVVLEERRAGK